jgi:hypothetical protein
MKAPLRTAWPSERKVCGFVENGREKEGERTREIDRQTDRQTRERERGREGGRERERERVYISRER